MEKGISLSEFSSDYHTDLHEVLQHVEQIIQLSTSCVNSTSGQMLSVAAAVECITLTLKLQRMFQRWQVYLPFRECYDVDFKDWEDCLTDIHKRLENGEHRYPDAPYRVDFTDLIDYTSEIVNDDDEDILDEEDEDSLPIYKPRYGKLALRTDVEEYVARIDEEVVNIRSLGEKRELHWQKRIDRHALTILREQYTDYLRLIYTSRSSFKADKFNQEVLPTAISYLTTVPYKPMMAYCLDMALNSLVDTLHQINDLLNQNKSKEQLIRLTLRLFYRYTPDVEANAIEEISRWSANCPARRKQDSARQIRQTYIERLEGDFGKYNLTDYIDIGHPTPLNDPLFGLFLFAHRQELTSENVKLLFHNCFCIQQLNRIINPIATEADVKANVLNEERRAIFERLKQLVYKANWQNGMTSERVFGCFVKLLLPEEDLSKSESSSIMETSNIFWELLTNRRDCRDGFRSLKLTWLNLVGFFISRGVLTGKGPAICAFFFPTDSRNGEHNDNDYNNVSKGIRDDVSNVFRDLTDVLDKMLGFQSPKKPTQVK